MSSALQFAIPRRDFRFPDACLFVEKHIHHPVEDEHMVTYDGEPQGRNHLLNTRIPEFAVDKEVTLQAGSILLGQVTF